MLRHPANSPQCRSIDKTKPSKADDPFEKDPRNIKVFLGFWCIIVQKKQYGKYNCNKVNAPFRESPNLYAARGQSQV
jgi:hypothetical protein